MQKPHATAGMILRRTRDESITFSEKAVARIDRSRARANLDDVLRVRISWSNIQGNVSELVSHRERKALSSAHQSSIEEEV